MIIDIHSQVWASLDQLGPELARRLRARQTDQWFAFDAGPDAHERAMACVSGSVVIGFRSDRLGARVPNEFIATVAGKAPHRTVGIASIDPLAADAFDQLDLATDLGLVGVAVSPACQGFHPTHSSAMRLYERCADRKLPLFVCDQQPWASGALLEFARPHLWDDVAQSLPELPIVLGHMGHPWIDETLVMLEKHANIYATTAGVASRPWQLYNALLSAFSLGVIHKLLFGSGYPFETPAKAIESLYSANAYCHGTQLPSIPRSAIRSVVERDSLAMLGITHELSSFTRERRTDEPAPPRTSERPANGTPRASVLSAFDDAEDE
jgi:predicted TIM-barrel fold metal-dependent hydrolase